MFHRGSAYHVPVSHYTACTISPPCCHCQESAPTYLDMTEISVRNGWNKPLIYLRWVLFEHSQIAYHTEQLLLKNVLFYLTISLESDQMNALWPNDYLTFTLYLIYSQSLALISRYVTFINLCLKIIRDISKTCFIYAKYIAEIRLINS